MQKGVILVNFIHFMHKNQMFLKEKVRSHTKKWLNCDSIRIKFVYLQQKIGFTND